MEQFLLLNNLCPCCYGKSVKMLDHFMEILLGFRKMSVWFKIF